MIAMRAGRRGRQNANQVTVSVLSNVYSFMAFETRKGEIGWM
jgi:hypothetical protein